MTKTASYAAASATAPLAAFQIDRREAGPHDVQIEILYCGVCHSDLHIARNEWKGTVYPVVPGHEIVGRVSAVGKEVKGFKKGDLAAVGCMVGSCRSCPSCKNHLEQYCTGQLILTYNSPDKHTGKMTYGGYSNRIVVDENYVLHIPKEFKEDQLAAVAPLLCAGITTYSPLRHWKVGKGSKVGVVGLGGLGHMAIQLAAAMGAHVTLFTSSANKAADAKKLGAHEIIISKDSAQMKKHSDHFDFIINTVSVPHDLDVFTELLALDGTMCLVGAPPSSHPSPNIKNLIFKRRKLAGSLIGGIKETQEMLQFCAQHNIVSKIELIPIQKINEAYERMLKSNVKYRFVIDMATLNP